MLCSLQSADDKRKVRASRKSAKKCGRHEFRLVRDRQTIIFFPTFDDALAAYFPDGFIPEYFEEAKQLPERYNSETPFLGDWNL